MNSFWFTVTFLLQVTLCDQVGKSQTNWRNVRKERLCFSSRGKRGTCLPPHICGTHVFRNRYNDIIINPCKSANDLPMVCCSLHRRSVHMRPRSLRRSYSLSNNPTAFVRNTNSLYSVQPISSILSSTARPEPLGFFSNAPVRDSSSSNSVQPLSSALSSTDSPELVSVSSIAFINDTSSSNSEQFASSTLSSDPVSLSSAASSIIDTSYSNSVQPISNTVLSTARSQSESISSAASVTNTMSFYSTQSPSSILVSTASPVPLSVPIAKFVRDTSFPNFIQPSSNALLSTDSPESVSSTTSLRNTRSSNSVLTPLSALSPNTWLVRYRRSLISGTSSSSAFSSSVPSNSSSSFIPDSMPNSFSSYLTRNYSSGNSDFLSSSNTTTESTIDVQTTPRSSMSSTTTKYVENKFITAFPEPPVCGVSQGVFSRVVGGNNASLGYFPWMGVIAYRVNTGFVLFCDASLITSQHALTAAHCIVGFEDILSFVRLGVIDLADYSQNKPVDATVKTTIAHQKFNKIKPINDIGLLVFHRRVIFTDLIRPICLPLSDQLRSNNFLNYHPFVAGWGRTLYQGPVPSRLQMLQVKVVSQESCRAAYESFNLDERVVCAGGVVNQDVCNGDSGGPLMQPIWDPVNYTTYFYQIGVVSFGVMCGMRGYPAIYSRVTEFIPWIEKHVLRPDAV